MRSRFTSRCQLVGYVQLKREIKGSQWRLPPGRPKVTEGSAFPKFGNAELPVILLARSPLLAVTSMSSIFKTTTTELPLTDFTFTASDGCTALHPSLLAPSGVPRRRPAQSRWVLRFDNSHFTSTDVIVL